MKSNLRRKAISLRREGRSYSEILKEVSVAKSTLSLWLQSVSLSKKQKQRLTEKKLKAMARGAKRRREQRLIITEEIKQKAFSEIKKISNKELLLMGTMLYWAEGSKAKEYHPSVGIIFSNSDPFMIKIFLKWINESLKVSRNRICFDIYIHETHKEKLNESKMYWAGVTGFSEDKFDRIYFKKDKILSKRKNRGENYHGLLRVKITKSTNLNRKITGWIEAICNQCGVV